MYLRTGHINQYRLEEKFVFS